MNILKIIYYFIFSMLFIGCINQNDYLRTTLIVNDNNRSFISGKIIENEKSSKPYYLVLLRIFDDGVKVVDFSTYSKNENFTFEVTNGNYYLYACQNLEIITDKSLGFEYYSDVISLNENNNHEKNIQVKMSENSHLILNNKLISTTNDKSILEKVNYGKITSMENSQFTRENASKGLWNPELFFKEVGGGIYMLEEYSSTKIPILFIHGMNGTPSDFKEIIENIDKNKYQPWVYFYPSGLDLNYVIDILKISLDKLNENNKLNEMIIISHSMGGLISRGFINEYSSKIKIPIFITISTPWNGQESAKFSQLNASYLPASFGNMVPGSKFQKKILTKDFFNNTKHILLFGYESTNSLILDNSNDGTISLSSQLFDKAQSQANEIYGFNENHTSILKSKEVFLQINKILAQ